MKEWINNVFIPEAEETLRLAKLESVPDHAARHAASGPDPITPDMIGAASNPNLLDNRYLADPINQRGQTEYTNSGYTIDRWAITGGTTLLVEDGHITLSMSAAYGAMYQYFEYLPTGHTYTFSLLRTDGTLWKFTFAWDGTQKAHWPSDDYYLEMNMVDGKPRIAIISNGANKSVSIIAVKLELGSIQTLAHQDENGNWVLNDPPPNKQQELAKCQRYFQRIDVFVNGCLSQYGSIVEPIHYMVQMRTVPAYAFSKTEGNLNETVSVNRVSTQMLLASFSGASDGYWYGICDFDANL